MTNNTLPSNWNQYFDPSAFSAPPGAGAPKGGSGGGLLNTAFDLSPFSPGIFDLFGGGAPSFKPYIDAQGNYVYADPSKHNPVPVTNVPGANLAPNKTYRDMANNISALTTLFPEFASIIAGQAIPQAQAQAAGAEATAPTYERIAAQNALAQVGSDTGAVQEASKSGGLLDSALAANKMLDPEYYKTRALTADKLAEQLNGIGPTVSREIGQGLAQSNATHGTMSSPSQLGTVSDALQYGRAGRDALTTAIQAATSAMPALRSGSDAFQVATGRSSTPVFSGTNGITSSASLGSGLQGNLSQAQIANNQNALTNKLQSKDWADYLGQVTSSIGNLTSSAGSIAGLCWIARRVYGVDNPKWKQFRRYLLHEAPIHLKNTYIKYGEQIANNISDAQALLIKTLMDKILGGSNV